MKLKHFLLVVFTITLFNLQSQEKAKPTGAYNQKKIAPDNCLVQAKILKVVPAWKKKSKKSCKVSPCLVYIKIIKVEKYGSSFPVHFSVGQKVEVKFVYSTKPSKEIFPEKQLNLPGLKKGTVFKAQINAKPQFESNSSVFKIYKYQLM